MKILVSNDDGIYARGLWALVKELKKFGEIVVVAPDREQSAVGTSVTLHQPLRVSEVTPLVAGVSAYLVEGTPADSIILALRTLVTDKVDLIFSGINEGSNLGNDVLISGTVGAALQGYFYELPAIAISVGAIKEVRFDVAAKLAGLLAGKIVAKALPNKILLNINLPNLPPDEIQGVELTRLAGRSYMDTINEGHDGRRKYYWIVRGTPVWNEDEGTDIRAVRQKKVSITPLQSDLTSTTELFPGEELCSSLYLGLRSGGV